MPAAVYATSLALAVVAPAGGDVRALHVEGVRALGGATRLVRIAVVSAASERIEAPRGAELEVDPPRGATQRTPTDRDDGGYAFVDLARDPRDAVEVRAEGLVARWRTTLPSLRSLANAGRADVPLRDSPLRVEGGALVPELPGHVLVRVDSRTESAISLEPAGAGMLVAPARAQADACGLADFAVTIRGLDGRVVVRSDDGHSVSPAYELPIRHGGLVLERAANHVVVRAFAATTVFVMFGDATGRPVHWASVRLTDASDETARAALPVTPDTAWLVASPSASFAAPTALWLTSTEASTCTLTPLGTRWTLASSPLPATPELVVLVDGRETAASIVEARRSRSRHVGVAGALVALVALSFGMLAPDPAHEGRASRELLDPRRERFLRALGPVVAVLFGGLLLLLATVLR